MINPNKTACSLISVKIFNVSVTWKRIIKEENKIQICFAVEKQRKKIIKKQGKTFDLQKEILRKEMDLDEKFENTWQELKEERVP